MASLLLAEDDDRMRAFLTAALERAGHVVTSCADGLDALKALETEGADYDLLLTDIVMPGMDGIELSRRAGALKPSLKIMFITGFAATALGQQASTTTDMRVLSKPFHLGDLVSQIDDILETGRE